jgi:hypothetical protein
MHHYRGKLFQGDKVRLDPANVYIDFRSDDVPNSVESCPGDSG